MTLKVRDLSVRYGDVRALSGVSFDVTAGEVLAVLGSSGAGKTSLLKAIAGVVPTTGTVKLDGADISQTPTHRRGMALVQETYALYPHRSVRGNAEYPLSSSRSGPNGSPVADPETAITTAAEFLGIDSVLDNSIDALSGGQRQRVALLRAIVRPAGVYLLDEPIAHLDAKLRNHLRTELKLFLADRGAPIIWTTPDSIEALAVADAVGVLVAGVLAQIGLPRKIFESPANRDVAVLVGDPPMNFVDASLDPAGFGLPGVSTVLACPNSLPRIPKVVLGVRATQLSLEPGVHTTDGVVVAAEHRPLATIVSVTTDSGTLRVAAPAFSRIQAGERVLVNWDGARVYPFDSESGSLIGTGAVQIAGAPSTVLGDDRHLLSQ